MKLVSVKDMKAQVFLQPNFQKSIPDALRSWEIISNEGESLISKFPNDFRLFHLANFDVNTGELHILQHPEDLGSAADFQKKPPAQSTLPFQPQNLSN